MADFFMSVRGKGIQAHVAVSEGMALRSSCLPDVPLEGPGEETRRTGGVPEKPCITLAFVNLSVSL